MPDDVARAVGSGSLEEFEIGGKMCTPRPLTISELCELERECLRCFKRSYLLTFSENLDLLPEAQRDTLMLSKMEAVAKWDVHDLPPKEVVDPTRIHPSKELRDWVEAQIGQKITEAMPNIGKDPKTAGQATDRMVQRLVATYLDSGQLSDALYVQLTKKTISRTRVGYVNWWVTGCPEGLLSMVWVAFKPFGVTKQEVSEAVTKNPAMLVQIAREVEHLSGPAVGNT